VTALGAIVATLALLAATTGFCTGCQIYRIGARLSGIRSRRLDRIDMADFGVSGSRQGDLVVAFGHPLCTDCQELETELRATGRPMVSVDVRRERSLARKYGIALVPTAVAVGPDGRVTERLAG
jgi:hypothetical protein